MAEVRRSAVSLLNYKYFEMIPYEHFKTLLQRLHLGPDNRLVDEYGMYPLD